MQNGIDYFAEKFVQEFNVTKHSISASEDEAKEIMSITYLEPFWRFPLQKLLTAGSDAGRIKKYISFAEDMYRNGDDKVKGIVEWIMLEYFVGFDIEIRRRFYKYLSPNLYEATKEVEIYLKDIHDKNCPRLNYRLHSAK